MEKTELDRNVKIGLEIHCQLTNLNTKLFCGCSADYRGKPANTHVCPVCLGIPGSLPVGNQNAVKNAILVALALEAQIMSKLFFFRKNYFYPDMPKNFQITQYDKAGGVPIAIGGAVSINVDNREKKVEIIRIQIEEDPAKLLHTGSIDVSPYTLVDYNRAGVALLEIVTEPCLNSPKEARIFLQKLRSILEHLGVSDGKLEGAMRCDANISYIDGDRVEIKNISSFKEVQRALTFEIVRQKSLLSRGRKVEMETRHWDDVRRLTISLRTKEAEQDYRYFPELDLVPLNISSEMIETYRKKMPELPDIRQKRFIEEYNLPRYDAGVLTNSKALADFFEECVKTYPDAKIISNWIMTDLQRWLHKKKIEIGESKITPQALVSMIRLINEGTISGKIAKRVLPEMLVTGKSPSSIVEEKGLLRISSREEIEQFADQVLKDNPQAVEDALVDEKAIHYLVGQLMKLSKGKADPQLSNRIMKEKLKEQRNN
jgi:aspartyl-tRNA(Asn)/glutamyl-tRNA(Gln) amidotransferase subunit B